jgi:hypothetical protein
VLAAHGTGIFELSHDCLNIIPHSKAGGNADFRNISTQSREGAKQKNSLRLGVFAPLR